MGTLKERALNMYMLTKRMQKYVVYVSRCWVKYVWECVNMCKDMCYKHIVGWEKIGRKKNKTNIWVTHWHILPALSQVKPVDFQLWHLQGLKFWPWNIMSPLGTRVYVNARTQCQKIIIPSAWIKIAGVVSEWLSWGFE